MFGSHVGVGLRLIQLIIPLTVTGLIQTRNNGYQSRGRLRDVMNIRVCLGGPTIYSFAYGLIMFKASKVFL